MTTDPQPGHSGHMLVSAPTGMVTTLRVHTVNGMDTYVFDRPDAGAWGWVGGDPTIAPPFIVERQEQSGAQSRKTYQASQVISIEATDMPKMDWSAPSVYEMEEMANTLLLDLWGMLEARIPESLQVQMPAEVTDESLANAWRQLTLDRIMDLFRIDRHMRETDD